MGRLFVINEVTSPEDVRSHLADPERHWREGYSAYELVRSWLANPDGLPTCVKDVLDDYPPLAHAELVEAFFERKVELGTEGRPSQNDVLAFCVSPRTSFVAAVEGKVKEPFGPYVYDRAPEPSRDIRVSNLCEQLGLSTLQVSNIRYQLIHRAVSALREARRYRTPDAVLLVHSFDPGCSSLADYQAFAEVMGIPPKEALPNKICGSRVIDGIRFHMGWISEAPASSRDVLPRAFSKSRSFRGASAEQVNAGDAARHVSTANTAKPIDDAGPPSSRNHGNAGDAPGPRAVPLAGSGAAVQRVVERIRSAPRSQQAKNTSIVSSHVSQGFKKGTQGEDYKAHYDISLRRAVAELGAYSGVQVSLLAELAILLRNETSAEKWRVIDALKASLS